jgi:hypothetical protein
MSKMAEKNEELPKTTKRRRNAVENTTDENEIKEVDISNTAESMEP